MTIADLRNFWRSELDRYRADGAFVVADRLIARFLESLDQLETDTAHGVLNLRQAAALCGYSAGARRTACHRRLRERTYGRPARVGSCALSSRRVLHDETLEVPRG